MPNGHTISVALGQTLGALLPVSRAREALDFQLHQLLGREGDHVAQEIGVGVFPTRALGLITSLTSSKAGDPTSLPRQLSWPRAMT